MDYRNILATGFLILCGAVFMHALPSANALPQGPNISLGSNPIVNFYGSGDTTLAIDSTRDFVITTFFTNGAYGHILVDGNIVFYEGYDMNPFYMDGDYSASIFRAGTAKLKIQAGQTVTLTQVSYYYVEGYYTH
jgi:hypothetical protein